jgi:hypothetical protein
MSFGLYILDESGEQPVRCDDIKEWGKWYEDFSHRRVAMTNLKGGEIFVSTVFLGVDHGGLASEETGPVLWETMVFRMKDGDIHEALECDRCNGNREQAQAMHELMCEQVEALLSLELELRA